MHEPEKMKLTSIDVAGEKREELEQCLKSRFPEVFAENRIDFDQLKRVLGEWVDAGKERFGLNWPGKAECMKIIQQPSVATLEPCREESVNFDESENLFIEGDNLEVLKLLQKSYFGKVKMIYIDPPYNTGKEFIYPDKYSETLETYLAYTGQTDDEGKKFSTNTETTGRFHSRWLNMMYPRLYLAKNLLKEDGVIFVSIDDNEAADLQLLMDEVFGSENHLVTHYVQVRYTSKTLAEKNDYQKLIEQVLVYQKEAHGPIKKTEAYSIDKFCWRIVEKKPGTKLSLGGRDVEMFPEGYYEIMKVAPAIDALKETWATGSVLIANASGKYFGTHLAPRKGIDGLGVLYKVYGIGEDGLGFRYFTGPKRETATKGKFFSGVPTVRVEELNAGESLKSQPIPNYYDFAANFGNCRHEGDTDFRSGKKPVAFISELINQAVGKDENAIIFDFFAGSASSAHAILDLNNEDKGNRKFIMAQLPEPCDEESEAFREGHRTIADIGKERIRRVIKKVEDENANQLDFGDKRNLDFGFRVFKLDRSNFKVWDGNLADADADEEALARQLEMHAEHVSEESSQEDILYELLLKAGFPLTTKVKSIKMAGKQVFSIEDAAMLICLEDEVTPELVDALAGAEPRQVICLDKAFKGNDQLKTNAVQTFKARAATRESEIVFMTV